MASLASRLALSLVLGIAGPALAAPGDLDFAFDGDGRLTYDYNDKPPQTSAFGSDGRIAVQPDGRILTLARIGEFYSSIVGIARFLPDGAKDASFGSAGVAFVRFGPESSGYAVGYAIAPLADGRILVAGYYRGTGSAQPAAVVARLKGDGTLDPSFGVDGLA